MAVHVNFGPQNEYQEDLLEKNQTYQSGNTDPEKGPVNNKSYYDSLFMGTPYEDLYLAILEKYKSVSPPESFFGFLTGKDKQNQYEHNMSLMSELEALAAKMYDEDYQSPANEVLRNSLAGLNSDLLGLTGQSAAGFDSGSQSRPNVSVANPLEVVSNTLSTVMQVYSTIKGFRGINLQNESMDLKNIADMMKMARPMIIENYAKNKEVGSYGAGDWADIIEMYNPFKGNRKQSKRFAKAFMMELTSGNYAAAEAAYKRLAGIEEGRSAYGTHVGNVNWSPDDRALFHYVGGMAEMSLGKQFEENKFNRRYYSLLSPDAKASFENEDYDLKKFLNRIRNKMNHQLYYDFQNGSILAGLLLMENGHNILGSGMNAISNFVSGSLKSFGRAKK